jgi:tRNA threonylcarbamoyladenosine biosynthesis protein TsaB
VSFYLLAIDTTSEHGSIALSEGERVIEEVAMDSSDGFGHVLFDQIARMLSHHSLALKDIDGFAAAAGPGSFTGVRVGLTAAKGLAEAGGKRVAAVSNLQALASFGSRPLRAPFIDAHRGEIYGAVYDAALELVREEVVMPFDAWLVSLPPGDLELIACDVSIREGSYPMLEASRVVQAPRAIAGAVAKIAARRFELGLAQDPASVDANYVRRSDAELLWREPSSSRTR